MKKDRYTILKIDSEYFLIFDSEVSCIEPIAQCRSEDHANLVVIALNRCDELDKIDLVKKLKYGYF